MAASDGDRRVWPAKHCPPQIPLFIHKLDLLGLRGRVVCSEEMCVYECEWVVVVKEYECKHTQIFDELRLNLCLK